jgi:hypothetical protein
MTVSCSVMTVCVGCTQYRVPCTLVCLMFGVADCVALHLHPLSCMAVPLDRAAPLPMALAQGLCCQGPRQRARFAWQHAHVPARPDCCVQRCGVQQLHSMDDVAATQACGAWACRWPAAPVPVCRPCTASRAFCCCGQGAGLAKPESRIGVCHGGACVLPVQCSTFVQHGLACTHVVCSIMASPACHAQECAGLSVGRGLFRGVARPAVEQDVAMYGTSAALLSRHMSDGMPHSLAKAQ